MAQHAPTQTQQTPPQGVNGKSAGRLSSSLQGLQAVDLTTLDRALLHDRMESKVILHSDDVPKLLDRLADDYLVLEHGGTRLQSYRTEYFDSSGLRNYHEHHNQRRARLKLRYRTYLSSGVTFFELKRNLDGRTVKDRRRSVPPLDRLWNADGLFFEERTGWGAAEMVRSLTVEYDRILLVKSDFSERVTIDVGMVFLGAAGATTANALAICEFKQPKIDRHSPAMLAADRRPQMFSKYCMGLASCDPSLKRNRFKKVFRSLSALNAPILPQGAC